jgi:hypothetical protein
MDKDLALQLASTEANTQMDQVLGNFNASSPCFANKDTSKP